MLKYWKRILKDTEKTDWEDAAEEIETDVSEHIKVTFKETMQFFVKETLPSDALESILKHARKTKKPHNVSSKKWTKKVAQCSQLREFLDKNARKIETRETLEEIMFPNMPEFWHEIRTNSQ